MLEAAIRVPARLLHSRKPRRFLQALQPRFERIALQYPEFQTHLDREWRFFESTVAKREGDWPRVEQLERLLLRSWQRTDGFGRSVRYILLVDAQLHQGKTDGAAATAIRALSERGDPVSHEIILDHVARQVENKEGFVLEAARALFGKHTRLPASPQRVLRALRLRLARLKKRQVRRGTKRTSWSPPS